MRTYRAFSLNAVWFLIAVNFLVFIFTLVRPEAIYFLGLTPAYFLQQPWTIITNLFVHASIGHLVVNMISLYFLGSFVLRLVGEKRFLVVYFLGGIVGNLFYLFLGPRNIVGVGASGAIFALGGALAIMAPRLPVFMFFIPIAVPLWVAIIVFLLISFFPGIAWQAHLGGLLLGLGAGYYFKRGRTRH
jgi:membrane associated rhomboid family serine protease